MGCGGLGGGGALSADKYTFISYEVHFHQVGVMLQTNQSNVLARYLLKKGGRYQDQSILVFLFHSFYS